MSEFEYLRRRALIAEEVLLDLGDLLRSHFPALAPSFSAIGDAWARQLNDLESEFKLSGQQKGE